MSNMMGCVHTFEESTHTGVSHHAHDYIHRMAVILSADSMCMCVCGAFVHVCVVASLTVCQLACPLLLVPFC